MDQAHVRPEADSGLCTRVCPRKRSSSLTGSCACPIATCPAACTGRHVGYNSAVCCPAMTRCEPRPRVVCGCWPAAGGARRDNVSLVAGCTLDNAREGQLCRSHRPTCWRPGAMASPSHGSHGTISCTDMAAVSGVASPHAPSGFSCIPHPPIQVLTWQRKHKHTIHTSRLRQQQLTNRHHCHRCPLLLRRRHWQQILPATGRTLQDHAERGYIVVQ